MACRFLHRPILHRRTPTFPLIQYRSLRLPRIQTLDPKALKVSDFRDLSGKDSDLSLGHRFQYVQLSTNIKKNTIAFPNQTTGFYYYWTHPDLPATAGQLRFRITPTNDPSLFESGSDLRKPNGMPWAVSVGRLLGLHDSASVQMLLKDGLVSKDLIRSDYFRIYRKLGLRTSSVLLESFYDVFPLSLPHSWLSISTAPSDGAVQVQLKLDDQSWVEGLELAEPGKQVYAHVRLQVYDSLRRPGLQVVRIFSPSGAQLDSEFPLIKSSAWTGHTRSFRSWYLQTTKEW
ncbi:hypothetical protein DFS33DRAFT_1387696 [Desarmillaria ectypa]|nr:hypothetical protein DFS33DRAFT_1387696 [Desarmillaria ectypa]